MLKRSIFLLFFSFCSAAGFSQSLDFIGLHGLSFGMKAEDIDQRVAIIDSTSAYQDTATYLRNTRCVIYRRKNENLSPGSLNFQRIEYECCDGKLSYVFFRVAGEAEIRKVLDALKTTFPKMPCSGASFDQCVAMDVNGRKMRLMTRYHKEQHELSFVLIAR